ncbi:hypothetical protein M8J76_000484 [Diaphorina citri]|nr:hypothetical protein M8J76_013249 [Diaphorina citri]KAI5748593.1 hypothetical protein M8J76_000484 [Diaphorina citri]
MSKVLLEEGFVKADSRNLPLVKTFTMANFFKSANYISPEMRNVKTERSTRADYADEAVGFVMVKRDPTFPICYVKARITPEHRVKSKPYSVLCIIQEEDEEILKAVCEDCAACQGGCKHAIAFVTWLHRRTLEPSVTQTVCYWRKSKLSSVAQSMTIIRARDITPQTEDTISQADKAMFFQAASNFLSPESLVMKHVEVSKKLYSVFHAMDDFKSLGMKTPDEFLTYLTERLKGLPLMDLAMKSKSQSASPLWHALRFGRITASKLYEAANCSTICGSLVDTIMGASKFKPTAAMIRGSTLEKDILKTCQNYYDIETEEVGLVIKAEYPIFGASPDGISSNHIWEVKAPGSEKAFKSYFTEGLEKPAPKYNAQMQLQMFLLGKEHGIYAVAKPDFEQSREICVLIVDFDEDLVLDLMARAQTFYNRAIFPKLFDQSSDSNV